MAKSVRTSENPLPRFFMSDKYLGRTPSIKSVNKATVFSVGFALGKNVSLDQKWHWPVTNINQPHNRNKSHELILNLTILKNIMQVIYL